MSSAVIIGAGAFHRKAYPRELIRRADRIVCCDGALAAYLRAREAIFGFPRDPDAVIGDMDSLSPALQERFRDVLVPVSEQETNDQTKAFHHILSQYPDVDEIHILGATGKREAHTLGNASLLMEYARECGACGVPEPGRIRLDMVSDWSTLFAITGSCRLWVGQGRAVSLLTPDNALRIRSEGLEWPTDDVVFDNWWKATLNRATRDEIRLEFSRPSVALVILD